MTDMVTAITRLDKEGTMSRHYLFTMWDGAGTVPPELSVARSLIERGHRVTVLGDPTLEPEATGVGAAFLPWREAPHLRSRRPEDDYIRDFEADNPPELIARMCERIICGPAAAYAAETAAAIARAAPRRPRVQRVPPRAPDRRGGSRDSGGGAVRQHLPAPRARPPAVRPRPCPGTQEEERQMYAAIGQEGGAIWNAHLARSTPRAPSIGLAPLESVWEQLDHADRVLLLSSSAFDFPGQLPDNVRYVGARLDDPAWAGDWEPPAGDEPLVLASLSTANMDQLSVLTPSSRRWASLPVRGVVTTGHAIAPEELPSPANVSVVRSAPHSAILDHAAAVVTHGGHGTVIKALAADVPLLVLPMGRDQNDNATRVTERGVGLQLAPDVERRRHRRRGSTPARRARLPRGRRRPGRDDPRRTRARRGGRGARGALESRPTTACA